MRPETGEGTRKLYSMTEEGTGYLATNRALVDAISAAWPKRAEPWRRPGAGNPAGAAAIWKWRCRSDSAKVRSTRIANTDAPITRRALDRAADAEDRTGLIDDDASRKSR